MAKPNPISMQRLFDQLSTVTPENAEATYQAFYPACAAAKPDVTQAEALFERIHQLYAKSDDATLQSYCLLYFGAVVDTHQLTAETLTRLGVFLDTLLLELNDFSVKDSAGLYVHFLSHATYLTQSIHDAGSLVNWQILVEAYLRAEGALVWHEDIVLAECLLGVVPETDFARLLAQLETGDSEGAKASNKRALWMAIKVINAQTQQQDDTAFAKLTAELIALVS